MKKTFSLLLSLVLILALAIPVAALAENAYSGSYGDKITYNFDTATGTLTLSGEGDMADSAKAADQPWYTYKDSIKKIVVEEGITSLGSFFGSHCGSVTELVLPQSSLETISQYVLTQSYAGDFIIPEGVETIEWYAFVSCKFSSIHIPSTVIDLPMSLAGGNAFNGCLLLKDISVHNDNPIVCSENGALYSKDKSLLIAYSISAPKDTFVCAKETVKLTYTAISTIPQTAQLKNIIFGDKLELISNLCFINIRRSLNIYFYGDRPTLGSGAFETSDKSNLSVYRLEGAAGWGSSFGAPGYEVSVNVFDRELFGDPWVKKPDVLLGDADGNGEVGLSDAVLVLRLAAGWTVSLDLAAADINGDGSVGQFDAILIIRYIAGWTVAEFA